MGVPFSRTLQSLRMDRQPWGLVGLSVFLAFPAVLAWVFFAKIHVYEVSTTARLEVLTAPQSVAAAVEGRVVESKLRVGLEVSDGDTLVIQDGESLRLAMEEPRQQIVSARSRLAALTIQASAERQSITALGKARGLAVQESQAQLAAAEIRAQFAKQSLQRAETLAAQNAIAKEDLEKIRSDAKTTESMITAAQLRIALGEQDRVAEEQQQEAELAGIQQEIAKLTGDVAINEAILKSLEHDLELKTIRAYVSGRVEEVGLFRVGTVVKAAEKLATIVPPGEPRVVAHVPVIAVGRIVPGQTARLRMDGYPWTQFGTLVALVTAVGNEASDGLIRVELAVQPDPTSRIPLQHGQTGSVEIEVERASPATLILRAAGQFLITQRPAAGA